MNLIPTCDITIGNASFTAVNEVVVQRSIHSLGATAVIKVPTTAIYKQDEEKTMVETAKYFKRGDAVTIKLGYDGDNKIEFKGYLKQINASKPVELECEDALYLLRKKSINKSYKTVTLKNVITEITQNTAITIKSNDMPDMELTNFVLKDINAAVALQKIKDDYGISVFFDIENNLYAGLAYKLKGNNVKFELQANVINFDDLKYVIEEDVKLKIKAVSFKPNGEKIEDEFGDGDGEIRTLHFYNIQDKAQLKLLAEQEIKKYKYEGYRGKITLFLTPFSQPCDIAQISDELYPERPSGNYYIESVETTFGMNGARKNVEIGVKLS